MYWDNAATTWPKPACVTAAVAQAFRQYGANPGRGGHPMAMATADAVYRCRESFADFFGLDNPSQVIFTANCTMGLNMVIKGLLHPGDHVIISDMEHNAVVRPLASLKKRGVTYSTAAVVESSPQKTVENFRRAITHNTRMILCTHASNVFGTRLPIREIGAMAKKHGLIFVVDAAQTAGVLPIHMQKDHIDFLCVPGHKGLYGPMGTGVLLCNSQMMPDTLLEGGTGTRSLDEIQPQELPERLESGTVNVPGICGLYAGLQWLKQQGERGALSHEMACIQRVYDVLKQRKEILLYTSRPTEENSVPLLSLNVVGKSSEETAYLLGKEGVAVRAGLHCAPLAHRHAHTIDTGTVRLAPSLFTGFKESEILCKKLINISIKP